jgi:23S rRNA (cytosine1962-C5)-methyltransferase
VDFSGAVQSISEHLKGGEIVEVFTSQGNYLGTGHFEDSSLAVKIFSFERSEINATFWKQKIENAYNLRKALGLAENAETNAYRLVFTEGDGLPGLIIDIYENIAVFQAQTQGMFNARNEISEALISVYNGKLKLCMTRVLNHFLNL